MDVRDDDLNLPGFGGRHAELSMPKRGSRAPYKLMISGRYGPETVSDIAFPGAGTRTS